MSDFRPFSGDIETPPALVCGTCLFPLDSITEVDGDVVVVRYLHGPGRVWDHEPVPVPFDERGAIQTCDFCGQVGADWEYPCKDFDFAMAIGFERSETHTMVGGWMACAACHDDIEADRWDAVLVRYRKCGGGTEHLAALHGSFRANRTGPAVLFGHLNEGER